MIRIGILGDIGSGKTYVSKCLLPIFCADEEVAKIYQKDRKTFNKLKKALPKFIFSFPIKKKQISKAILAEKQNLDKIIKIIHGEIKKKFKIFLRKNKKKKNSYN